jgi:hypothetical protein
MNLEQTLIALERAGWAALAAGTGVQFYADTFTENGLMVLPVGVFGKTDALHGLSAAPPWASFDLQNLRVLPLTDAAASVIYTVEAKRPGQPLYRAAMSSTYVQHDCTWKLALHTQTPLTA